MSSASSDTIAAIATPPGNGGVGIIRISGVLAQQIASQISPKSLPPRSAIYTDFRDSDGQVIDSGLLLSFPAPASFTGEDCIEIQGHGGQVVMDMLLQRVLSLGARMARPGEFSERAFLNNKIDLAQAEAIADLINSSTQQAVRSAQHSMQGVFSRQIHELGDELTELRVYVEAAIDFVDEEIDFLSDGVVEKRIQRLMQSVQKILSTAQQGRLLRDGMTVVLAGKPNAGKSSLLNALAGHDAAIVTDIAGTTRDVLRERIQLEGMPLHIIDTAGLRESANSVEQEGIRRAHEEISKADIVLLLIDSQSPESASIERNLPDDVRLTKVYNKIDLLGIEPEVVENAHGTQIYLSVKSGEGMNLLHQHLKQVVGFQHSGDDVFIARRRHVNALQKAQQFIDSALQQVKQGTGDLAAEDLRQAQNNLSEITGEFTSDDLLGEIFSSFCIGK